MNARERRGAFLVLVIVVLAAVSSALMVGSIFPFLAVLAEPERIQTVSQLKWMFDFFSFQSNYTFLVALGLLSTAMIVFVNAMQMLRIYALLRFTQMRRHTFSVRLLAVYLGMPYEFFLNKHSGAMANAVLAEAVQAAQGYLRPFAELIAAIMTAVAITILLIWINPQVTLSAFAALSLIYYIIFLTTRKKLRHLGQERVTMNRLRFRLANEVLGGIKDIKILAHEESYVDQFSAPSSRMARILVKVNLMAQLPQLMVQTVAFGGIILVCMLFLDKSAFEDGGVYLGEILPLLGVFAFAGQRLMPELSRIYQSLSQLQHGRAAVEHIFEEMTLKTKTQPLLSDPPSALGLQKALDLCDVNYHYPGAETGGVKNITLSIQSGEKIGVVGSTGAGKTTFADIVLGLLHPQSGYLRADGVRVTDKNLQAWQRTVGYVPQDIFLVDASVAENIALGVPKNKINFERVQRAARSAQIEAFITSDLPNGYDTAVGERGVRLSGGQRQRIGIARALYHDADLIVFDEATSALDNNTEKDLMTAIQALPGDKTIIMIAHRLSTVRPCDRILVLEKGQIENIGSWNELLKRSKVFSELVKTAEKS